MSDFLETLLTTADPVRGLSREATLAELVDFAVARLPSDFADAPGIRGSVRRTLASTYLNLGLPDKAKPLFDLALAEHLGAYGESHPETLETQRHLAVYEDSVGQSEASLRRIDAVLDGLAAMPGQRLERALALGHRGAALASLGRNREALDSFHQAVAALQRLEGAGYDLLTTLNNLAVAQLGADRPSEAVETLRGGLERAAAGGYGVFPLGARMHTNLGLAYRELGNLGDAERHLALGAAQLVDLLGADHPETLLSRIALAEVLRSLDRLDAAASEMGSVLEAATTNLPAEHYILPYAHIVQAQILVELGRGAEAEPLARAAVGSRRRGLPAGHWLIASSETTLAAALLQQGRRGEALQLLEPAYRVLAETRGESFGKTREARSLLGEAGAAPR